VALAVRLTGKVGFDENPTQRVARLINDRVSGIPVKPATKFARADCTSEPHHRKWVAMEFALKEIYYSLFVVSLGIQACSVGSKSAMAAEHSSSPPRRQVGNSRLQYIKVETVKELDVAPAVHLTGKIGFDEDHTQRVAAPIDGRVSRILVKLGDKVRPGQALVELTSPHVSELQADAQKARQDLDVSTKALERAKKLKEDGAVSEKEAALAEADYRKDKSDAARANAQLRSMRVSPTDPNTNVAIRAQIAGTIIERNVLVGQEVRDESPEPLFTISALDTVWVQANVHEQEIGLVHKGDSVKVSVPAYADESFDGKVDYVGDVLDPESRTIKVRCSVRNPGFRLKPEMFAEIALAEATDKDKKVIVIPSSAILTDSEHTRIFVAGNDHVYRQRVITVGSEVDDNVRVLSGVQVGEQVVTQGALFLTHGIQSD